MNSYIFLSFIFETQPHLWFQFILCTNTEKWAKYRQESGIGLYPTNPSTDFKFCCLICFTLREPLLFGGDHFSIIYEKLRFKPLRRQLDYHGNISSWRGTWGRIYRPTYQTFHVNNWSSSCNSAKVGKCSEHMQTHRIAERIALYVCLD